MGPLKTTHQFIVLYQKRRMDGGNSKSYGLRSIGDKERKAQMQENIERLREISEQIDELYTEAIDIVSGHSESIDDALVKLQQDSNETLEEVILEVENEPEMAADGDDEDEIDEDEID